MCCISVYFMGGNYNMYAKTKSDNIDYEAVSKELETEIKKYISAKNVFKSDYSKEFEQMASIIKGILNEKKQ